MARKRSLSARLDFEDRSTSKARQTFYYVTGIVHGSVIIASTEREARRAFKQKSNGEHIVAVTRHHIFVKPNR